MGQGTQVMRGLLHTFEDAHVCTIACIVPLLPVLTFFSTCAHCSLRSFMYTLVLLRYKQGWRTLGFQLCDPQQNERKEERPGGPCDVIALCKLLSSTSEKGKSRGVSLVSWQHCHQQHGHKGEGGGAHQARALSSPIFLLICALPSSPSPVKCMLPPRYYSILLKTKFPRKNASWRVLYNVQYTIRGHLENRKGHLERC